MAWRIADSVIRGELDNRTRDVVTGRLWLLGRADPIVLNLKGNPYRDLAGCLLTFEHPKSKPGDSTDLATDQTGVVGDITASRKVYVLDVSVEEAMQMGKAGQPVPKHQANCLYLEWYSRRNGRVVIESADYHLSISPPAWTFTAEEEEAQKMANQAAVRDWMESMTSALDAAESHAAEDEEDDGPMDEFAWEKFMKESDAKTERLGQVIEKYHDHPDAKKLIAREMGWKWLEEALEAEERGETPPEQPEEPMEPIDEPELNPLTEGREWIRDEHGHPVHPLYLRAFQESMIMWHYAKEHGFIGEQADPCVHEMIFKLQMCTAKMAGVLNSLGYRDDDVDCGFIVAGLKRGLNFLHEALNQWDVTSSKQLLDPVVMEDYRGKMLKLREDVLALMDDYRRRFRSKQG